MSDKWLPPPGHGYPPPQPGGYPPQPPSYAYVPAAVLMPGVSYPPPPPPPPEPQQPTYVTNYIYQQPVEPVRVVEAAPIVDYPPVRQPVPDSIDWISCTPHTAYNLASHAVVAGNEGWNSSPLYVIRAHHSGDLIPGKLSLQHRQAHVAYGGNEVPVHNIEVLCAPRHLIRWVPARNGQVPAGAIAAGNTNTGEKLYVGRANCNGSLIPGKVHPSHGCVYVPFNGNEVPVSMGYEVLCKAANINVSFSLLFNRR